MIKKLLWLVILVLITACSVYIADGGLTNTDVTPTVITTVCADCTAVPSVTETPAEATTTLDSTEEPTESPTEEPTATSTTEITEVVTSTAEATMTATSEPTATSTEIPTATPTDKPTATATVAPTATELAMTFTVQSGSPVYMVNFSNTSSGCKWSGVAGQVFDDSGSPLTNYILKIAGTYNGKTVSKVGITGMVDAAPYGPASFEITLSTTAVDSTGLLTIQLFDPNGKVLTDPISFDTYSDCSKNLMIINFIEK